MLNAGWDDDLRAFAKSWTSGQLWLKSSESVHPKRWQKSTLGTLQAYFGSRLANLPSQLSRADLFAAASGINANPDEVFLLTMMWGYNNAPYGARRTNDILSKGSAAARSKISGIFAAAKSGNFQAAFNGLHDPAIYRLSGLATSFGSKLIYVAGYQPKQPGTQPLILDSMVTNALAKAIDPLSGELTVWYANTKSWQHYWDYCDLVWRLRSKYVPGARIDMVEHWLWLVGSGVCWHHYAIRRNRKYP